MNDFLEELKELLAKHNVTILRSAAETNKLVVSKHIMNDEYDEIEFDEEINDSSIKYKWFKQL